MNGHILEDLPIAVDRFLQKDLHWVKLHFLTHMHTDHTCGLSSSWKRPIYCTHITSKLLKHKFNISPTFIKALEENETHFIENGHFSVTVSVIPANHCMGSCMFLFQTDNKQILYTGDFRFDEELPQSLEIFLKGPPIDTLYLDNTYCEPVCSHPSREEAIEMMANICKEHSESRIMIGVSWVGHEEMLIKLSEKLNDFISVDESVIKRLEIMEITDHFQSNISARLNALPNHLLTCEYVKAWNKDLYAIPTIGIKPTAMYGSEMRIAHNSNGSLYMVPYSNHCNYQEICDFVKLVCPVNIRPIVSGRHGRAGMESFFRADMRQFSRYLNRDSSVLSKPKTPADAAPVFEVDNICSADISDDDYYLNNDKRSKMAQNRRKQLKRINRNKMNLKRGVVFHESPEDGGLLKNQKNFNDNIGKVTVCRDKTSDNCELRFISTERQREVENEILHNIDKLF
ncbi:unnamed protein product [Clavelina lepadiformis]|uniref:Protein artemis n=1 Tax=Clavelina lepadiformis TaxID=159417 RepID=A0ABP0FHT0_CLALP